MGTWVDVGLLSIGLFSIFFGVKESRVNAGGRALHVFAVREKTRTTGPCQTLHTVVKRDMPCIGISGAKTARLCSVCPNTHRWSVPNLVPWEAEGRELHVFAMREQSRTAGPCQTCAKRCGIQRRILHVFAVCAQTRFTILLP